MALLKDRGVATANRLNCLRTTLKARTEAHLCDTMAASSAERLDIASSIEFVPLSLLGSIVKYETVGFCEKEGCLRRTGDPDATDLIHLTRLKARQRTCARASYARA